MDRTTPRRRRLRPVLVAFLGTALLLGSSPATAFPGTSEAAGAAAPMRFTFPSIGLDRPVYEFGCRGGTLPNLVERWGCAGGNNTYLLGHAWGVFRPLHDAYATGRLRVGQAATLSAGGAVRTYRVAWIRVVPQTFVWHGSQGDRWAWNSTDVPSLTLQTCWGSASEYRIIVRLTA